MSTQELDYYLSLVDKMLTGTITKKEQLEVQQTAEADPAFQEAMAAHIEARANIRIAGEQSLKKKLAVAYETQVEIPIESVAPTASKPTVRRMWWPAAAAAALVGVLFVFYFLRPSSTPTFQLADHLDKPPSINVRGAQNNATFNKLWTQGEQAYHNQDYSTALYLFTQLQSPTGNAKSHEGKLAIYLGMCYLQLKEHGQALEAFNQIPSSNPLFEEAEWYSALTLLDKGKHNQAKSLLEKIAHNSQHYKQTKASELLQSID